MLTIERLLLITLDAGERLDPISHLVSETLVAATATDLEQAGALKFSAADPTQPAELFDPKVSTVTTKVGQHALLNTLLTPYQHVSGQRLSQLLTVKSLNTTQAVGESLSHRGFLVEHSRRFGASRFEVADHGAVAALKRGLVQCLDQPGHADFQDRAVLGFLEALNASTAVLATHRPQWNSAQFSERINAVIGHIPAVQVMQQRGESIVAHMRKSQLA